MGVAGYSEIAHILGLNSVAERYADIAKKMAMKWEEMANEGDHYRLRREAGSLQLRMSYRY